MSAMNRVSAALQDIARRLGDDIERVAGERLRFSLFVWSTPRCSYISTAARAEVIQVLEGMIARWRQGLPDVPAHEMVSATPDHGYELLLVAAEQVLRDALSRAGSEIAAPCPDLSLHLTGGERALFAALKQFGRAPPASAEASADRPASVT